MEKSEDIQQLRTGGTQVHLSTFLQARGFVFQPNSDRSGAETEVTHLSTKTQGLGSRRSKSMSQTLKYLPLTGGSLLAQGLENAPAAGQQ